MRQIKGSPGDRIRLRSSVHCANGARPPALAYQDRYQRIVCADEFAKLGQLRDQNSSARDSWTYEVKDAMHYASIAECHNLRIAIWIPFDSGRYPAYN